MNPFFRVHPTDVKNGFFPSPDRRRRRGGYRTGYRIRNDGYFFGEAGGFCGDRAGGWLRWRLQSRRVSIKAHLTFRIAGDLNITPSALSIAHQNRNPERI